MPTDPLAIADQIHPAVTGHAPSVPDTFTADPHLLVNGDNRSVVLFGGLGAWALAEIVTISRREGPRKRVEAVATVAELKPLLAAVAAFVGVDLAHPLSFGVSPWPV